MATHHDRFTSTLSNGFASLFKELNIQQHNNNPQGYASSIQMGNKMQYAGQYVGNQIDHIVNQNVLNKNGIDCFMTSIHNSTSDIHCNDIGNNYDINAMTKVEKIQYLLMLANKEESGIPLTGAENNFIATTRVN
jgi:hypothetical protein